MTRITKEGLSLVFEFVLSMTVLVGGGYLAAQGIAPELASTAIGIVLAYWFSRRQSEHDGKKEDKRVEAATRLVDPEVAKTIATDAATKAVEESKDA